MDYVTFGALKDLHQGALETLRAPGGSSVWQGSSEMTPRIQTLVPAYAIVDLQIDDLTDLVADLEQVFVHRHDSASGKACTYGPSLQRDVGGGRKCGSTCKQNEFHLCGESAADKIHWFCFLGSSVLMRCPTGPGAVRSAA